MWKSIETSPKYPIDQNYSGPHFIAIDERDGYAHECWWQYPHPMSQAYKDNSPPSIQRIERDAFVYVKAKGWIEMPAESKLP